MAEIHITETDIQGVHPKSKSSSSFSKISIGNMEIRTFRVTYNGVQEEAPMREPLMDSAETALLEADTSRPIVQSARESNNDVLVLSVLGCVLSAILGYLCNNIQHRKRAAQSQAAGVQMASRGQA